MNGIAFYLAEQRDSPESIAEDILGYPDSTYAQEIEDINEKMSAWTLMPTSDYYIPERIICIPPPNKELGLCGWYGEAKLEMSELYPDELEKLYQLIRSDVDINHLAGISMATQQYNQTRPDSLIAKDFLKVSAVSTVAQASGHVLGQANEFSKQVNRLNEEASKLVTTFKESDNAMSKFYANEEFKAIHQEVTETINRKAKLFRHALSANENYYFEDADIASRIARKRGIFIQSIDHFEHVLKIARYGKFVGRGAYGAGILLGADDVYTTYKQGGDWERKAVGVAGTMYAIGEIGSLCLLMTPPGWVALVGVSLLEGSIMTFAGGKVEKLIETAYDWINSSLRNWL